MQFHLYDDIGRDNGLCQYVCEVICQTLRRNPLNLATGQVAQRTQSIDVALVALDRDEINGYTAGFGQLAYSFVKFVYFLNLSVRLRLIVSAETLVRKTVRADDNGGAHLAFARHRDSSKHSRTQCGGAGLFNSQNFTLKGLAGFFHSLFHHYFRHFVTILNKPVIILQFIACDSYRIFRSIPDHSHIVIEGDNSNFSVLGTLCHHLDLRLYRSLHALESRHISHTSVSIAKELVGTITEVS